MRHLALVLCTLLLAACASGGGSSDTTATSSSGGKSGVVDLMGKKEQTDRFMSLADKAKKEGRADLAAVLYRAATLADEKDPAPRIASAQLLEQMGEYDAAASMYSALAKETNDSDLMLYAARNYLKADKLDKAADHYNTAIAQGAGWRAYNGLGVVHDFQSRHKEAQQNYEKAFSKADGDKAEASVMANWALSLMLGGEAGQAVKKLEGFGGAADNPKLRLRLALAYGLAGRVEDARRLGLTQIPTYDDLNRELKGGGLKPADNGAGDVIYAPIKP